MKNFHLKISKIDLSCESLGYVDQDDTAIDFFFRKARLFKHKSLSALTFKGSKIQVKKKKGLFEQGDTKLSFEVEKKQLVVELGNKKLIILLPKLSNTPDSRQKIFCCFTLIYEGKEFHENLVANIYTGLRLTDNPENKISTISSLEKDLNIEFLPLLLWYLFFSNYSTITRM